MFIDQAYVDATAPKHTRTSCCDTNICNGYGGWDGKYDENTGAKRIHYPRCIRCYLLSNIGGTTEHLEFEVETQVSLNFKERK